MANSGIAISRIVWAEGEPGITVGPSGDCGEGYVQISCDDKDYYGFESLTLPCDMAEKLAEALLSASSELRKSA